MTRVIRVFNRTYNHAKPKGTGVWRTEETSASRRVTRQTTTINNVQVCPPPRIPRSLLAPSRACPPPHAASRCGKAPGPPWTAHHTHTDTTSTNATASGWLSDGGESQSRIRTAACQPLIPIPREAKGLAIVLTHHVQRERRTHIPQPHAPVVARARKQVRLLGAPFRRTDPAAMRQREHRCHTLQT